MVWLENIFKRKIFWISCTLLAWGNSQFSSYNPKMKKINLLNITILKQKGKTICMGQNKYVT